MAEEKTTVTEIDDVASLDQILNIPGVSATDTTEKKNNVFSAGADNFTQFLNEELVIPSTTKVIENEETKILDEITTSENTLESGDNQDLTDKGESNQGRPKLVKDALISVASKLIEKGVLLPFDEDKPLDQYTNADFEELIDANIKEKEKALREQVPLDFFDSLPDPLKVVAKYASDGGQDFKGLFRSLAGEEEIKSLDPNDESDAVVIVRSYLQATNFGTPEDIQEEIDQWMDSKQLVNKAVKFKPKLDSMQEAVTARKLQDQEKARIANQKKAKEYTDSVYDTIEKGELNGVKLDKKVQQELFNGLVRAEYQSINGRPINKLGHLLEKYQVVEPNLSLVAEALWLLSDPEGYKNKIKEIGETKATEKTVRMLKQEQANKAGTENASESSSETRRSGAKIPRQNTQNFFKRP